MGAVQFGLPELKPTKPIERSKDGRFLKFTVEASKRPVKCPNPECPGVMHVNKHVKKEVQDLPHGDALAVYVIDAKQYQCSVCGQTLVDNFDSVIDGKLTVRLRDKLVERVLRRDTFRKIAFDYNVSDQMVRRTFQTWADAHAWQLRYETPCVLGLDEAHIDKHYRLLVVDIERRLPIDMLRNNKYETVVDYLERLPNKGVVKAVTMDFKETYANAVEKVFHTKKYKPLIIIDHYHVIQDINRKMDAVRKRVQAELGEKTDEVEETDWWLKDDEPADAKKLKKEKKLFMMNMEDLEDKEMSRLSVWMRRDKRLEDAYYLKEQFREIYRLQFRPLAEDAFDVWCGSIPKTLKEYRGLCKYFKQRREHILNYFDLRVTNAFTESANRIMKNIEQSGRGYDFEMLKRIVLFSFRNPRPPKVDPFELEYETDYRY